MDINKEQIKKIVPRILKSRTFRNSQISRALLRFLVDATLRSEVPKETTIAIQVFKKGTDFNSSEDPTVRVNVSKLRQRLNDYYASEGRHDKIRLQIPKGHYEITFQSAGRLFSLVQWVAAQKLLLFFIATTFIFIMLSYNFWQRSRGVVHRVLPNTFMHSIFWGDFISSSTPTNVVLSNQYFFREELADGRYNLVRNFWVNTKEDLELFRQEHPDRDVEPLPSLMQFDKNSIWGLQHVLPVLAHNPQKFYFSAITELMPQNLKESNVLYVGSLVELNLLRPFLEKAGIIFQNKPNKLFIRPSVSDSLDILEYYWTEDGFHNDYAIVAKLPAPNDKSIGIFAALNYMGNLAMSQYFTNSEKLAGLEDAFLESDGVIPRYFVVVFEATGLQRVEFDLNLKYKWVVEADEAWR